MREIELTHNSGPETLSPKELRDKLMEDNNSAEARSSLEAWEQARRENRQTTIIACGDARLILPYRTTLNLRSIAAAGLSINSSIVGTYLPIIDNQHSSDILVVGHFAGSTLKHGQSVRGCGGLGAKETQDPDEIPQNGVSRYIYTHIQDADVYLQTIKSAHVISKATEKPVVSALQDHITGNIYPIAVFSNQGKSVELGLELDELYHENFNPKIVYEYGIPVVDGEVIPQNIQELLTQQSFDLKSLKHDYPDFEKTQEVQNPKMIVMTTENRSIKLRYPQIAREPGSIFKLHIGRNTSREVPNHIMQDINDQLNYPIALATENHGKNGQAFSSTDTLLIETEDMSISYNLAINLMQHDWMRKWIGFTNHSIMFAQTEGGTTQDIGILEAA